MKKIAAEWLGLNFVGGKLRVALNWFGCLILNFCSIPIPGRDWPYTRDCLYENGHYRATVISNLHLLWWRILVLLYLNILSSSFLWCFMPFSFPILLFKLLLQDLKGALQTQAYSWTLAWWWRKIQSLHQLVLLTVSFHTEGYALSIAKVRFSARFYCNAQNTTFCFNEGFQLRGGSI